MTRVMIVADSGHVFASMTAAVCAVPGAHIARHASSRKPLDRIVAAVAPDLVVVGDVGSRAHALRLLEDLRRSAPSAKVVLLSSGSEATWLADALRAHATAALPGALEPHTLAGILAEIIGSPSPAPALTAVGSPRLTSTSRATTPQPRRVRRARPLKPAPEEQAA